MMKGKKAMKKRMGRESMISFLKEGIGDALYILIPTKPPRWLILLENEAQRLSLGGMTRKVAPLFPRL